MKFTVIEKTALVNLYSSMEVETEGGDVTVPLVKCMCDDLCVKRNNQEYARSDSINHHNDIQ